MLLLGGYVQKWLQCKASETAEVRVHLSCIIARLTSKATLQCAIADRSSKKEVSDPPHIGASRTLLFYTRPPRQMRWG